MVDSKYVCPNCKKYLSYMKGPRMFDAIKLLCKNCNSNFIRYSRSGTIIQTGEKNG